MTALDPIFKASPGHASLPLQEERELIIAGRIGSDEAVWLLLLQYRGALQRAAHDVQQRVSMTPEQVEDLQAELVLAAVEAIKTFDLNRYIRLSQVLPAVLKHVALETTTALAIPRGTLNLWFKVWRAADQDFEAGALMAPGMGMSTDTFRAITHALNYVGSEWVTLPGNGNYRLPAPDEETARLAEAALQMLTVSELDVIELFYGFRGEPKTDKEVADMRNTSKVSAVQTRQRALARMREGLAA